MFSGFREIRYRQLCVYTQIYIYKYIYIYIYLCNYIYIYIYIVVYFGSFFAHVFCQASTLQELPLYRSTQGLPLTILDHGTESGCWSWIRSGSHERIAGVGSPPRSLRLPRVHGLLPPLSLGLPPRSLGCLCCIICSQVLGLLLPLLLLLLLLQPPALLLHFLRLVPVNQSYSKQ